MFRTTGLLFTFLLIGCSDPDSTTHDLTLGEAVLAINSIEYQAEANLGKRLLGETEYEQISLIVSDSISIDILNKDFKEGIVTWSGETFTSEGTMLFLRHHALGGAGYGPTGGYLIISDITGLTISGRFDMELYNFASSCYQCPQNEMSVEGQFFAQVE